MISIGLFGFGKTGSMVAREIMNDPDCELKWVMRKSGAEEGEFASTLLGGKKKQGPIFSAEHVDHESFYREHPVDVIVDFSSSQGVEYYRAAADQVKVVSAISHYEPEDISILEELSTRTAVLYSPNITLGVNFLIVASRVLQKIADTADIEIVEEHFRDKRGKSGTALRIAELLGLCSEEHVNSIRVGGIVGKHEVIFGLPNQTIRIIHETINRAAFGRGALYAAKWLMGKTQGLFTMEDVILKKFTRVLDSVEETGSI